MQSAKLKLRTQSTPLQGLRVYWIATTSWTETGITWNNGPMDFILTFPTSSHPANSLVEIDVSSIVSGNGTYTIALVSPDAPNQSIFSREATLFSPSLEVTY